MAATADARTFSANSFLSNISIYETAQRVYVIGQDAELGGWRLLKFDRTNAPELSVVEDPTLFSWPQLKNALNCLHQGNLPSGGLRKVAGPCPALVGCFRWSACHYLLLVTRARILGRIGGAPVHGIDATALVPLAPAGEVLPQSTVTEEARARRLLALVDLTKDFFFSFSWPIWSTVQRTFQYSDNLEDAFYNDRVWTQHLTGSLRSALGNARWTVPLVHGFFQQRLLSLLGTPLTLTLVARRSSRFAGTRYRKRGISDDGFVANDVEVEQIVEVGGGNVRQGPEGHAWKGKRGPSAAVSSVVQVRGSVPLCWSQAWDGASGGALRPAIRMLHHLDPLCNSTRKHFDDLQRRYGDPVQCLDLLRHGDSRQQESMLSREYKSAVAFVNRHAASTKHRVGYVHWDLRRHARSLGSNLLADLQAVQAPLLQRTGIFVFSAEEGPEGELEEGSTGSLQQGAVRTNCVDCVDRTNVAQFTYGLLALGAQLHALDLSPTSRVDPQSSLAAEMMGAYEAMGHALAQQYGGSEAHAGFFQRFRGDWQAALQGRDLLTSIRRFYSNAVTDEDKQEAINLFLGAFSPVMARPEAPTLLQHTWSWPRGGTSAGTLHSEIEGGSPPSTPALQPSLSTASLASELDGGADITLPEVLSAAVEAAAENPPRPGVEITINPAPEMSDGSESSVDEQGEGGLSRTSSIDQPTVSSLVLAAHVAPVPASVPPPAPLPAGPSPLKLGAKRWWPRVAPPSPVASAPATPRGGLESLEDIMRPDVRLVRLTPPVDTPQRSNAGSWLTASKSLPVVAPGPLGTSAPASARGRLPPPPLSSSGTAPLIRSTSGGVNSGGGGSGPSTFHQPGSKIALPKLDLSSLTHPTTDTEQQQPRSIGPSSQQFARQDLRGTFVVSGAEAHGRYSGEFDRVMGSPVLPTGSGAYHTLAGLNLEGAPELPKPAGKDNFADHHRPMSARPSNGLAPNNSSSGGLKPRGLGFASFAALRNLVGGGGGGVGDPLQPVLEHGQPVGSNTAMGGGGGSGRPMSRSGSALDLHGVGSGISSSAPGHQVHILASSAASTAPDYAWLLSQHYAVAHGFDDLGLSDDVAPLWRRGTNILGTFADLEQRAAKEQAAVMQRLAMPMGPVERRAAERQAAGQLRPVMVVPLPGKA